MLLASKRDSGDPGLTPESTSLEDEECEFSPEGLIESFARNLMRTFHLWREQGFSRVAEDYLSRLSLSGAKARATIAENGDLVLLTRTGEHERLALLPALQQAAWLDPLTGHPRL
jgi:biotin-(acetyl-CoA carboxylase) ligase